jgi:hypothetical protein
MGTYYAPFLADLLYKHSYEAIQKHLQLWLSHFNTSRTFYPLLILIFIHVLIRFYHSEC